VDKSGKLTISVIEDTNCKYNFRIWLIQMNNNTKINPFFQRPWNGGFPF